MKVIVVEGLWISELMFLSINHLRSIVEEVILIGGVIASISKTAALTSKRTSIFSNPQIHDGIGSEDRHPTYCGGFGL